ncbi:IS200/IS605 family transposase [Sabulicella rubraurantiaca]|uniref:IS200/IS605 family transposase n=1 Tax=Sabulicella rubraurantiaca TaxID=2811429 RepID=UPI001A968C7E
MAQQELDALHHCVFALHSHLVLVTRFRRKALTRPMLDRFDVLARGRVEAWGGRLIETNGEPEHVHLLFTLPPKHALADIVNALKTGTSRRLRSEFPEEVRRFPTSPYFGAGLIASSPAAAPRWRSFAAISSNRSARNYDRPRSGAALPSLQPGGWREGNAAKRWAAPGAQPSTCVFEAIAMRRRLQQ